VKVLISSVEVLARIRLHKEPLQESKIIQIFRLMQGAHFAILSFIRKALWTGMVRRAKVAGVNHTRGCSFITGPAMPLEGFSSWPRCNEQGVSLS